MAAGVCVVGRPADVVRLSRHSRMAAQLDAAGRAARRRGRGSAGHGADARHARGPEIGAVVVPTGTRSCSIRRTDVGNVVASAFARYPYPGVVLRGAGAPTAASAGLLHAIEPASRRGPADDAGPNRFPVTTSSVPVARRTPSSRGSAPTPRTDAASRSFSCRFGGVPHQVIVRLLYQRSVSRDSSRGCSASPSTCRGSASTTSPS